MYMPENVLNKIILDPSSGCIRWGAYINRDGYGMVKVNKVVHFAHKYIYEFFNGNVVEGLELDHLCRNPNCVNPLHLEQVTHKENVLRGNGKMAKFARQTHCKRGHPLSGSNLQIVNTGRGRVGRRCVTCYRKEY